MLNVKVFIHGSCITRDIFRINNEKFSVEEYVARTSIPSVVSPAWPAALEEFSAVQSAFQKRMLLIDFNKLLFERIAQTTFDYYLIDLIDERFNLIKSDQRMITKSAELIQSNYLSRKIKYTDIKRLNFPVQDWKSNCVEYMDRLKQIVPEEPIVIFEGFWAEKYRNLEGNIALFDGKNNFQLSYIKQINQLMRVYYDYLSYLLPKASIIRFPEALAAENHQWGLSPFHYEQDQYHSVYRTLCDLI